MEKKILHGWDKGLVIEDATNESTKGSQFVWIPVQDVNEFRVKEGYFKGSLDNMIVNCKNEKVTEEANSMYTSIVKNGGFYIARFEAGIPGMTTETISNHGTITNGTIKPISKLGIGAWNFIIWGGRINEFNATDTYVGDDKSDGAVKVARSMYPNIEPSKLELYQLPANIKNETDVKSTLVYAIQWDAIMTFLKDVPNITTEKQNYIIDSTDMGNYGIENTPGQTTNGKIKLTGQYQVKNIYDLAGNVYEWTMEAYGIDKRLYRGGAFNGGGLGFPASTRNYSEAGGPNFSRDVVGFRVSLYI